MVELKGNKMLGQRTPVQRGPERTEKEKDAIRDATYGALSLCPALSSQRSYGVTATVITKTDGSPQTEGSMATFLRCHRNPSLSPLPSLSEYPVHNVDGGLRNEVTEGSAVHPSRMT